MAKAHRLITHDKKDSTGICFIGERKFQQFLSQYLPAQPGHIETVDGQQVGIHQGLMYYTLGQRKGIGIGGLKNANDAPWYVVQKDLKRNVLIIAQGDHPLLYRTTLYCDDLHWITGIPPIQRQLSAKIRYRQTHQACAITLHGQRATVVFEHPQRAITAGQSIVFYDSSNCLGGGTMTDQEGS